MTKKYIRPRYSDIVVRDREIATANTQIENLHLRIRELESKLDRYTRISEAGLSLGDHLDCIESLAAEREVSDKLVAALKRIRFFQASIGHPPLVSVAESMREMAESTLAEVAALRKGQA